MEDGAIWRVPNIMSKSIKGQTREYQESRAQHCYRPLAPASEFSSHENCFEGRQQTRHSSNQSSHRHPTLNVSCGLWRLQQCQCLPCILITLRRRHAIPTYSAKPVPCHTSAICIHVAQTS